jgi:hypothetical protein
VDLDLEQARVFLGVSRGNDPREIRRAYFRRLRDFRPDQDPQGFMRLREAHDLLIAMAGYEDPEDGEPADAAAPPTSPEAPVAESSGDPGPAPDEGSGEVEADAPDGLAAARARTEREPSSLDAWWTLIAELEARDLEEELVRAYHAAIAAGHVELLDDLASAFPAALLASEVALLEAREDSGSRMVLFRRALGAGDAQSAAAFLADALERFAAGPGLEGYAIYWIVQGLLDLFSAGGGVAGAPLVERLWLTLETQQVRAGSIGDDVLVQLVLLRELAPCAASLSPEVCGCFADQIRWEISRQGVAPLWAFRSEHPEVSLELPAARREAATHLVQLIPPAIDASTRPVVEAEDWHTRGWHLFQVFVIGSTILYAMLHGGAACPFTQKAPDQKPGEGRSSAASPGRDPATDTHSLLVMVEAWLSRVNQGEAARTVGRLRLEARRQDCAAVGRTWLELRSGLRLVKSWSAKDDPAPVPSAEALLRRTHRLLHDRCPDARFATPDIPTEAP